MPSFARTEHAVLTGIWRRDQEAAAKACAEYSIPHCFRTAEELCASDEVDVVFITSPDAMHLEDSLLAFRHGKAVLCEKPLAMNSDEAARIDEAARAAGVLFGVGQNFRYNQSLQWMREQIAAGKIGQPQLASAQYAYPAQKAARKWIVDTTLACGGPIADVGVHCIDALRYLLDADVETVSVLGHRDELSGESDTVDAWSAMQMEMTGGVFANVTSSGRALYRTQLEVTGSEGAVIAEDAFAVERLVEVKLQKAGVVVDRVTVDNADCYVRMMDDFARAYRGEGSFLATGADGVRNQRALDAAFRSWKSGARERV
jgi:predicted dehydrogenase